MRLLVRRGLAEEGHVVDTATTGPEALTVAAATEFDAIVLDLVLPGFDGIEVVRRLRLRNDRTPVLMLTARDAVADIVRSLDAGADDHLAKPFAFAVLLARLRALGRRGIADDPADVLRVADLSVDRSGRTVTRGGVPVKLTRTEYDLLECLMLRAGRVVTRDALVSDVWGPARDIENNTLDAFVRSLRLKVDAVPSARLIQTIRGVGYSLRVEPE